MTRAVAVLSVIVSMAISAYSADRDALRESARWLAAERLRGTLFHNPVVEPLGPMPLEAVEKAGRVGPGEDKMVHVQAKADGPHIVTLNSGPASGNAARVSVANRRWSIDGKRGAVHIAAEYSRHNFRQSSLAAWVKSTGLPEQGNGRATAKKGREAPAQPQSGPQRSGGTVRDFGALGDGKTDDTAAIQRAVGSGVGSIRFPTGEYRITKPILVQLDRIGRVALSGNGSARLTMAGEGPALKVVGTHMGTAALSSFKDGVYERERMPVIDGLEIIGDHPKAGGIALTGTMQATLTRLLIHNVHHAIHLPTKNRNVIISECHLYYNTGIGVYLDNIDLHQINITNCHIMNNEGGGIVVRCGDAPGNVRNLQIVGCDIESNMGASGPPTANILLDCSRGQPIGEGAIVGCTIQHNSPDAAPGGSNIRIIGRDADRPVTNFNISGNAISDVEVNVRLERARGITLTGNTIWMGYSRDLLIENSSDVIVANNMFDRSPENVRQIQRRGHRTLRGVMLRDSRDCVFTGNQIKDAHQRSGGLVVERCRRVNITDCSVYYRDGRGVLLEDVEQVRFSGCMVMRSRPSAVSSVAIALTSGKHNMILGNMCEGAVEVAPEAALLEHNVIRP